jgi:hypothetical protein
MRISEAYPSKYLKAADLDGQDRTVSIRACVQEELGQGAEMEVKPVLYFDGGQKGLVLNKTNAQAIVEDYGDDTEAWTGREIVLFIQKVTFQGKLTPAIRVRVQNNAPQLVVQRAPAPPAPEPDAAPLNDEIPW